MSDHMSKCRNYGKKENLTFSRKPEKYVIQSDDALAPAKATEIF